MPEFRKDPVVDRWVILATDRAKRPQQDAREKSDLVMGPCPFCAGNEAMTPPAVLTYDSDGPQSKIATWSVRVVPNKYPAVTDAGGWMEQSNTIYQTAAGLGAHEVVIEAPEHVVSMAMLDENQFERILNAYRDRIMQLQTDSRWRSTLIYKNQGADAGATLEHVHSQLIALPLVPKALQEEVEGAKNYHARTGSCIYCAVVDEEIRAGSRIVAESGRFIVFCPHASRFPYETWILPKQHASRFDSGSAEDYRDLARLLRDTLVRLERSLGNLSLNYLIHSNPSDEIATDYYHWHLEILPKVSKVGGFEWGSGIYINSVAPEHAARHLRDLRL